MSRKVSILSILSILTFAVYAQKSSYPTPPNGIHLYENLYIDETEISNLNWLEYLYHITDNDSNYVGTIYYYLNQTEDKFVINNSTINENDNYTTIIKYEYYPIVNISYENTIAYSRWRSRVVTKLIYENSKNKFKVRQDSIWYYNFRLPTEKEWEYAASTNKPLKNFPYGLKSEYQSQKEIKFTKILRLCSQIYGSKSNLKTLSKKYKSTPLFPAFNCKIDNSTDIKDSIFYCIMNDEFGKMPSHIYQFPPNDFKIYGLNGNVSEMIEEKNMAKGGNFSLDIKECKVSGRQKYDTPQTWLGFRNVCEVYKIPNPY